MNFKELLRAIYPVLVGALLLLLLLLTSNGREAFAGTIRRADLSPEHPLVVRLALGRSTALSFPVRPEKVVPGNPQGVEINFLGRDLTLRPLSIRPGNLIVYTKSSRYVVLLQIGSESAYDDSVSINGFSSYSRPIRLSEDSFTIETIRILSTQKTPAREISAISRNSGRVIESDALSISIRCTGCVAKRSAGITQLICSAPITVLQCRDSTTNLRLERTPGGG